MIDFVMLVLGELSIFQSQLSTQRPQVPIVSSDETALEIVTIDVADHIMLQGSILSSGAPPVCHLPSRTSLQGYARLECLRSNPSPSTWTRGAAG